MSETTVVMKFGGAAVASPESFSRIADIIVEKKKRMSRIVIVISAMGDTTNQLAELAIKVHPEPPRREYDMLLTAGERISIALLAMALAAKGCEAISFTGSQSGIITSSEHSDAKIEEIRPHRIEKALQEGKVVIVAGFQGVSRMGEITTLGRGGSDTTAVALGVALNASAVEFYKDVDGIYDLDPKYYPEANHFAHINYRDALAIVSRGAKILQSRSIQLAERNGLSLIVRSFVGSSRETIINDPDFLPAKEKKFESP